MHSKKFPTSNDDTANHPLIRLFSRLNTRTKILLGFSVPMSLLVIICSVVYFSIGELIETSKWVKHTQKVIADGKELEKLMIDMETGERGFLITGKDNFLEPFNQAQKVWQEKNEELQLLVADNDKQVTRLKLIDELEEQWLQQAAQVEISARRNVKSNEVSLDYMQSTLRAGHGKEILDQLRVSLAELTTIFVQSNTLIGENIILAIGKDLVDQETGQRGFLITGSDEFLQPYHQGKDNFNRHMSQLRQLIDNNYQQTNILSKIERLESNAQQWLIKAAEPEIKLRDEVTAGNKQFKDIEGTLIQATGKSILDNIRIETMNLESLFLKAEHQLAINTLAQISKNLVDQETGQRGYLITGRAEFLQPYENAKGSLIPLFKKLREQVKNNYKSATVLAHVDNIQNLSSRWLNEAAIPEISTRREINKTGLSTLEFLTQTLDRNGGKALMANMLAIKEKLREFFINNKDLQGENYTLKLAKAMIDQEAGERGFLITGEESYLVHFYQGKSDFEASMLDLMLYLGISNSNSNKNYQDLKVLKQDLLKLRNMQAKWHEQVAKPELNARREIDKKTSNSLMFIQKTLTRSSGKDTQDEIRQLIEQLDNSFTSSNIIAANYLLTIAKAIVDQETGQRGFLITGEESFLDPYHKGKSVLRETFPKLKNVILDSFDKNKVLDKLSLVAELNSSWKKQAALPEIELRKQFNRGEIPYEKIVHVLSQGRGKGILDKLRFAFEDLKAIFIRAGNDKALYLILLLEKGMIDQETGQRGYLVTGRDEFLQPFEDGQLTFNQHLSELTALIQATFEQAQVLNQIEFLRLKAIEWENNAAAPEISLRRKLNKTSGKMSDVTALIEKETGKKLIDQIRSVLVEFVETERQLMLIRESEAEQAANNTVTIVIAGSIISIVIAFLVSLLVSNSIVRKLAMLVKATEKVTRGDYERQIFISSSDEFGQLALSFNNMTAQLKASTEEMSDQNQRLSASEEELKEQSEELKASNEELEEKQQELRASNESLALQQDSLEKQSKNLLKSKLMLEEKAEQLSLASKYKSEFLANMSHELRTPLNSLLILSKSLYENKQGNLTKDQVEEANIVYQGGQTLLTLINDIMDLSKVEAGMLSINLDSFLPGDVRDNLDALFSPVAKERKLNFEIHVDDRLNQDIKSDKQRLEQILKNFLSNAFKFTEHGSVRLDIHPYTAENPLLLPVDASYEQKVCFTVSDTGIGIPEQKQNDIFEAFQQADGSTSRQYGGTGLGLTISKELAALLGGKIEMVSGVGNGSRFTLILPLNMEEKPEQVLNNPVANLTAVPFNFDKQASQDKLAAFNQPQQQENQSVSDWLEDDRHKITAKDKTLLLIEDDHAFSQVLIDLIHNLDLKVIATNKGREGVLLAVEHVPQGILLDLGLPDIDGLRVLEQLKHNLQTRHIPVHVISAGNKKMESLHLGALSYQQKPADPAVITSTLQEVYDTSKVEIKSILVVEDDYGSQQAIKHLIAGRDTELSFAASAKEACERLSSQYFDCIILDLGLPDLSGTELVKTISEQPGAKNVPIIIYTGQSITQDEYRVLNQFTPSIVIKGAESPERLLDDVSLFLHHVGEKYSNKQHETLQMLHDENAMLAGRRVLVVDDDMRNVFAITRILEQTGIEVIQAENGQVAIDLIEKSEQPIELILMDIMMPVMDGFEAIARIRKMEHYQDIPIIALTAKAMPGDRHHCITAGASEYLTKPLDMDKVLSMLRVWLYRRMTN